MLIFLLAAFFSLIMFYIGFYLFQHRQKDFMLFKVSSSKPLQTLISPLSIFIMVGASICLILACFGNVYITMGAMIINILITTSSLVMLSKFL
ncbi:hypothetical protein AYR57_07475 [Pediococcus claussenii]|nr:hypothetical protein AYR57_07475 [Pediococcus claussenii]ANZ71984.1 hypothetical protein AYR58_07475 [Pediococcus claussenii]